MAKLTFGSLFAGIGGIDLGFERAGFECRWQVEIDTFARQILAKHWPNVHQWDDVRTWPQPDTEPVDIIVGGFPCQDISYAGKGAGLHGERSGLWYEFARVVREMGPSYVVVENVAALLNRGMGDVLGTLAAIEAVLRLYCPRDPATLDGVEIIAAERKRQIEQEGWSEEHDDTHKRGQLGSAASCYALPPHERGRALDWPWDRKWWKPTPNDRIRELAKAGALIAAEIDRLNRLASSGGK